MAKFKVGDRVRVIAVEFGEGADWLIGKEGVIAAKRPDHCEGFMWAVSIANQRCDTRRDGCFIFEDYHLSPLTPPAADEWATEQVKKVTKPEPVAPTLPVRKLDHA